MNDELIIDCEDINYLDVQCYRLEGFVQIQFQFPDNHVKERIPIWALRILGLKWNIHLKSNIKLVSYYLLHWLMPYCEWGGIWSGPNCRLMRVEDPDLLTWGGWVGDMPYWLPPNPVFLCTCKFAKDSKNQKYITWKTDSDNWPNCGLFHKLGDKCYTLKSENKLCANNNSGNPQLVNDLTM